MTLTPQFFLLVFLTALVAGFAWALGSFILGRLTAGRSRVACLVVALLAAFAFTFAPASAAPRYILTSSSPTACTSIATAAQRVLAIINASTSAQTVTLSVYDEPGSPTCASGDLIYSVVLTASQVVNFPVLSPTQGFLSYGLAYKLSAAATNNIVILYQ